MSFLLAYTTNNQVLARRALPSIAFAPPCTFLMTNSKRLLSRHKISSEEITEKKIIPPWNDPRVLEKQLKRKKSNYRRFRQHVNPLARQYQQPTLLSDEWPTDVYHNCQKPLHLDIGCGKGGFLLDLAAKDTQFNYLGLEIRPLVVQYANERIAIHNLTGMLDFVGCNVNVDLERIIQRCQKASGSDKLNLQRVSIQFPDPLFKAQQQKRRVVTPEVVAILAKYMPADAIVFLQSDVQFALDQMRCEFRNCSQYFVDSVQDETEYLPNNILGVPTEREVSVIEKGEPVYRAVFTRIATPYQ